MGVIGLLITPSSWLFDLIAILFVAGIGCLYSRQMSLYSWVPKNHVANLTKLLSPPVLISLASHFVAGGFLMRSYLGLLGGDFNSLTVLCPDRHKCLNVPHIFLVLSACFMSVSVWKDFHFGNQGHIQFPTIPQTGNAQLTRQLSSLIKTSFTNVCLNIRWFYGLYILTGHRLVNVLSEISRMEASAPSYLITTSVWKYIDLLLQCLILNSLLTFTLGLLRIVICINFTKRFNFDVTGDNSLIKSMTSKPDLLNHLAFYEFSLISQSSRSKRSEFYALSLPGGHPHNWASLSNTCLTKLEDFVTKLNESAPPPSNPQMTASAHLPATSIEQSQFFNSKSRPLVNDLKNEGHKKAAANPQDAKDSRQKGLSDFLSQVAANSYPGKIYKAIRDKVKNNALFATIPDAGTRSVFGESQTIIWAVEGLLLSTKVWQAN